MAQRKRGPWFPFILGGVVLFYVAIAVWFGASPMVVIIPVALAGWFYYVKGGLIAGVLALPVNMYLFGLFNDGLGFSQYLHIGNGITVGHFFIVVIGAVMGYLRREFEGVYWSDRRNRLRERQLIMINLTVKDILENDEADIHEVYDRTLHHLCNLLVADFGYLIALNETAQKAHLVAVTRYSQGPAVGTVSQWDAEGIVQQALGTGHGLIIENGRTSPLIARSPLFQGIQASVGSALAFPLFTKAYQFGVVVLAFETPQVFDREEIAYFELISRQVTLALKSVLQERRIKKQFREAQALASIERALGETEKIGLDAVLQRIVNSALELVPNTTHASLHLLDEEQRYLIPRAVAGDAAQARPKLKMKVGEGIAGLVISSGTTIAIPDVQADPRFLQQTLPVSYRSLIVSPVQVNKKIIGTISVHSDEVGIFDPGDINLLSALGSQVAIAIENADLLEATRENLRETNALYHVSRSMASSLDAKLAITETVDFLQKIFKYYHIQVYMADGSGRLQAFHGAGIIGDRLTEQGFSVSIGEGIIGYVAETSEPFFTNDVGEVLFYMNYPLLPETASEMALPIVAGDRLIGVLDVQETAANPISLRHMKLMNMISRQMGLALQKVNLIGDLQASLNQEKMMRAQLLQNERLVTVGRLLASISHELNNPLQAIQNVLFLLKSENLSEQAHQDLDVILSETDRMTSLISRLRATYRTPQADEFKDVVLNSLIEDMFALTATYMRHKNIAFEFHPDMELPPIPCLPDQVRQVLLNLFMNAIDAMPDGGKLIVQTRNLPEQKRVLLTVTDSGTGISSEILPHLFEPFVTDKHTGTGLGLTITHDIVRQHDGEIQAHNLPQGGAEFCTWLPTVREMTP